MLERKLNFRLGITRKENAEQFLKPHTKLGIVLLPASESAKIIINGIV